MSHWAFQKPYFPGDAIITSQCLFADVAALIASYFFLNVTLPGGMTMDVFSRGDPYFVVSSIMLCLIYKPIRAIQTRNAYNTDNASFFSGKYGKLLPRGRPPGKTSEFACVPSQTVSIGAKKIQNFHYPESMKYDYDIVSLSCIAHILFFGI